MRAGSNELTDQVANTWVNRIIGDRKEGTRYARTIEPTKLIGGDTPVPESGLTGPVTVLSVP